MFSGVNCCSRMRMSANDKLGQARRKILITRSRTRWSGRQSPPVPGIERSASTLFDVAADGPRLIPFLSQLFQGVGSGIHCHAS